MYSQTIWPAGVIWKKDRQPKIYNRLREQYLAWNRTMPPLDKAANTGGFTGQELADHFGVDKEVLEDEPPRIRVWAPVRRTLA